MPYYVCVYGHVVRCSSKVSNQADAALECFGVTRRVTCVSAGERKVALTNHKSYLALVSKAKKLHTRRQVKEALERTYDYIAADLHQLEDSEVMTGKELQEVVPDYLSMHGGDKDAAAAFEEMTEKEQDEVLEEAFPSSRRYGN